MPRDKDVKRVVRKRMAATGERYTQARSEIASPVAASASGTAPLEPAADSADAELVEVEVGSVRVHMPSQRHVVVLKERGGGRCLPIWVGVTEANAIALGHLNKPAQRPITADLLADSIRSLGGAVERVVITRVDDSVFYAEVHVTHGTLALPPMDARPSDALGVAVRTRAPIFVAAAVMRASAWDEETSAINGALAPQMQPWTTPPAEGPTHMLIEAESGRMVTLLTLRPGAPSAGVELMVPTESGHSLYEVLSVEPHIAGLPRVIGRRITAGFDAPNLSAGA